MTKFASTAMTERIAGRAVPSFASRSFALHHWDSGLIAPVPTKEREQLAIAVGIPVTWYPRTEPDERSLAQRIRFLSQMSGGEARIGKGVERSRRGKPALSQSESARPRDVAREWFPDVCDTESKAIDDAKELKALPDGNWRRYLGRPDESDDPGCFAEAATVWSDATVWPERFRSVRRMQGFEVAAALVPIPIGWLLGYAIAWVRRGFAHADSR